MTGSREVTRLPINSAGIRLRKSPLPEICSRQELVIWSQRTILPCDLGASQRLGCRDQVDKAITK
jgi:hypothetical protein